MPDRRSGVSFRLAGFPVRVDPLFVVVMGVLGLSAGAGAAGAVVFVAVALVGVLLHELGHAVAARASGHRASIVLYGFGGATSHAGPALGRARQALVSVAGPAVGLAAGGLLELARPLLPADGYAGFAVSAGVLLTLGLGVLNLLPVLPLDGGQLLATALPGDDATRRRRAAAVGLAIVVLVAGWALARHETPTLLLALWLGYANVTALRPARSVAVAPAAAPVDVDQAAVSLVDAGRADHAAHLLATAGAPVDPRVALLVAAAGGDDTAYARLAGLAAAQPDDAAVGACFVRAAVVRGDFAGVARAGLRGQQPMLAWAAQRAREAGDHEAAAALVATA